MATRLLDDVVRETVAKIMATIENVHHADQHFVVQALLADDWFRTLINRARASEDMYGKAGERKERSATERVIEDTIDEIERSGLGAKFRAARD